MEENCPNCRYYLDTKNCPRAVCETNRDNIDCCNNKQNKPCDVYKPDRRKLAQTSEYFDFNELTGRVTFVPKKLADAIRKNIVFATNKQSEEIFYYKHGYFVPNGKVLIHELCAKELEEEYRSSYSKEVIDYIKAVTYQDFNEPPTSLINFKNGLLNFKTAKLHPHTPTHIFLQQIPHNWNEKASCIEWVTFFEEVTGSDQDKKLLISSLAYTLLRERPFDKSIMLIGTGSNGKTVLLRAFQKFLGKENVSSRNLQELCYDRFATADLVGKLANISGDLSNNRIGNTGIFKQLTGKDSITVQKKFLQAQTVDIYAKLIFATNQPPEPKSDVSLAYFRRWNLITFPHVFMGEKKDPFKIKKLTTQEEMEGLGVLLVKALQELIQTGGFPETQSAEEIKKDYMKKANPIQSFAEDMLIENEGSFVKTDEIHKAYVDYCKEHNYSPEGKNKFRQAFEKLGYLYERKTNRRGFADIKILSIKPKNDKTLDNFNSAKNAKKEAIYYRKVPSQENIKESVKDNSPKNGKNDTNQIDQLFDNKCPNCDLSLPNDETKIMMYKGKRYHTHCHAKISNSLPKRWYVEGEK